MLKKEKVQYNSVCFLDETSQCFDNLNFEKQPLFRLNLKTKKWTLKIVKPNQKKEV